MLRPCALLFALVTPLVAAAGSPLGLAGVALSALEGDPDTALVRSHRLRLAEGGSAVSDVVREMVAEPYPEWGELLHEALLRGVRVMDLADRELPDLERRLADLELERKEARKSRSPSRERRAEEEIQAVSAEMAELRRDLRVAVRQESLLAQGIRSVSERLAEEARGELAESLAGLLRRLRKPAERATVLQALAAVPHPRAVLALMEVVRGGTEEAETVLRALRALIGHADPFSLPAAILALDHPDWRVQSEAVELVRVLHQRSSIPFLIQRLAEVEGRLKDDVGQALNSLTGQDFSGGHRFWKRWWEDTRPRFVMPPRPAAPVVRAEAPEGAQGGGAAFYGIQTWSRRVVFVVDVSGSMAEPARTYGNARGGTKVRKIDEARRNLKSAVMALHPDARFNVVLYSDRAWAAFPEVQPATQENKEQAVAFAQGTEPKGGTNIHDGLSRAFELAMPEDTGRRGVEDDARVDTIYFLSDGQATTGQVKEPGQILTEVDYRNRLRRLRIHTVGIGAHDKKFMRALAEQNRGTYLSR